MTMNEIVEFLEKEKILPVVVIEDPNNAIDVIQALMDGGINSAEITDRTAAAEKVIQIIHEKFPDFMIGAGTVLTIDQAKSAITNGAKFIVSPGLNPEVVKYVLGQGVPMIPGVCTPSEIEQAMSLGLTNMKLFPAEVCGGVKMLKALAGPYRNVRFMPTGGINKDNFKEYLALTNVICCGGSWIVKENDIAQTEANAKEVVEMLKNV